MNAVTGVVATGTVVALGTWSQDKSLTMRNYVGLGVMTGGLAVLSEVDAELASKMASLILVAAILYYGIPIVKWLGYTK